MWAELPVLLLLAAQALCYSVLGLEQLRRHCGKRFFFPLPAGGMRRIPREEEEGVRNVVGVQVAMDVDTQRERERGRERDKRKVCWAAAVPTIIIIFNCTSTTSSRGGSCPAQKCFPAGLRA